jgi:vancomycin resistance protein YoaR
VHAADAHTEIHALPLLSGQSSDNHSTANYSTDNHSTDSGGRPAWTDWKAWKHRIGWEDGKRPPNRVLVPAGIAALLMLVYVVDLLANAGDVPRGTVVAGVHIGGDSRMVATSKLRTAFEPLAKRPVPVRAGTGAQPVQTNLDPDTAGLKVDYPGTLHAAGGQPFNPFTRLTSLFSTRDVDPVTLNDNGALSDALDAVAALVHKDPTDGGIRFVGINPTVVLPAPGTDLDVPAAVAEVRREWLYGRPITLPLRSTEPTGRVTPVVIQQTIDGVAKPAVSGDVKVVGDSIDGTAEGILTPSTIAGALTFAPDGGGGLRPVIDVPELTEALHPQLLASERPGKDATVTLVGGTPETVPSENGHGVDYPATLAGLPDVLKRPADPADPDRRKLIALYADQPAKLTTEQVDALGIRAMISTFSTGGFAKDSGENIHRAADAINGRILQPGETFSLNDATGPRDARQGYVEAGIIEDGHPARGVGGGVSQLATTLYNAAYFAGMTDVSHREHSYYISRYPAAREATVYEGAIDLKFRNDSPTGVFIQTVWTPASITVNFWGTKHVEVTSTPGEHKLPVPQQTITLPAGETCHPSNGGPGFTTTDTKTVKDLDTGRTTSSVRTVKYKPSPKVVCAGGATPAATSTGGATPDAGASANPATPEASPAATPSAVAPPAPQTSPDADKEAEREAKDKAREKIDGG